MDPRVFELGILTAAQLGVLGWSKWQIECAVRDGGLQRVRPGWFGKDPVPQALAAVRSGGCISCFSALRLLGAWVPERKGWHVRSARHRGPTGCRPHGPQPPVSSVIDDLETSFRCVLRCGSKEDIVVIIDSLLHERLATKDELQAWTRLAPLRIRALLDLADGRSEAGTESMVRLRTRSLRIATRIQVRLLQGMRVDVLLGERLVIECDSREHHTDSLAYERDRARDRRLVAAGFLVLRLSYRQIHDEWPAIEQEILAIVRRGDHLWPRHRSNQR
ncbi:endonuclease domain-containing protein [Agrococcus jenensis]|uniref:Uncharacterized protein DUF559 n=1 Tax=Agrococcus jenensis TaxID=46353 RepID=A0A3N2ASU9_9MICO|nr:DUF559 domain-containing protein [Agrococcus jenensis]ROR66123.1 uncharacterized protein DUF559 [Agrococcus jenensis]